MNSLLFGIGFICLLAVILFSLYFIKVKRSMNLNNKFEKYTIRKKWLSTKCPYLFCYKYDKIWL